MMFHNTRKRQLADVRVRQALDLAVDRKRLSQELRGGHATRSLCTESAARTSLLQDLHLICSVFLILFADV